MKNLDLMCRLKQFMCALLVCVMTVSLLPVSAFATQTAQDSPAETAPIVEDVSTGQDQSAPKTFTYTYDGLTASVTAQAADGKIADVWTNIPTVHPIFFGCTVLDISLVDHVPGTEVEVVCSIPYDLDTAAGPFALYSLSPSGIRTRIYDYEIFYDDSLGLNTTDPVFTFTMDGPGRIAFGPLKSEIPADAIPTDMEVKYYGKETFFVQEEENEDILDEIRAGLSALVTYADGTTLFEPLLDAAGYDISVDMTEEGYQTVTVTLSRNMGTVKDKFSLCFCAREVSDNRYGVLVEMDQPGILEIMTRIVTPNSCAIDNLLDHAVAYDILVNYALGDALNGTATVTLPIPDGVTNPAVYYVSDDGATIVNMHAENNGDGTVSFVTDHFSTFAVGESRDIDLPDAQKHTSSIYVLSNAAPLTGIQSVLIVNRSTNGDGYALTDTLKGGKVTVQTSVGTNSFRYIKGSNITANYLWDFGSGLSVRNQGNLKYLRYNNGLTIDNTATNWTAGANHLYYRYNGRNLYYLTPNNNNTWVTNRANKVSNIPNNLYFYIASPLEYSVVGNNVDMIVTAPTEVKLTSTLTETVQVPYEANVRVLTSDISASATYAVPDGGDPNGVIAVDGITGNTVQLTGNPGTAMVKVTYSGTDISGTQYTVANYMLITATQPEYRIDITQNGETVTKVIPVKGVTSSTTLQLGYTASYGILGEFESFEPDESDIEWTIPAEYQHLATVTDSGLVRFKGVTGTIPVTVHYGDYASDTVTISANIYNVSTPADGTSDFPEYPEEGSIRFDKSITAVGDFSETGLVQVELSLTGVPYSVGAEIDVVIMMDMSSSMSSEQVDAARSAANAALEAIVKKEDGTFNGNRVAIYTFNGWKENTSFWGNNGWNTSGSPNETYVSQVENIVGDNNNYNTDLIVELQQFDATKLTTAKNALNGLSTDAGTNYAAALKQCYTTLKNNKVEGRQQFVIFMSDGAPTTGFAYVTSNGDKALYYVNTLGSSGQNVDDLVDEDEYYSRQMKNAGVSVYTVALHISNQDALTVLSNISGNKDGDGGSFAYTLASNENANKLTEIFSAIVSEIKQAATNVVVQDKVSPEYTMVFDIPSGAVEHPGVPDEHEFHLTLRNYTLNSAHERTEEYTTLMDIYLGQSGSTYYAATDAAGTRHNAPVFANNTPADAENFRLYYKTVNSSYVPGENDVVITVNGTRYLFCPKGDGTLNVTSGAYAYGTIDSTNTSTDLVIITPYFAYSAATKMLVWTVDKVMETELALSYFLYLNDSATEKGTEREARPGAYPTNAWAGLNYDNFNGTSCEQEFPGPQATWSGAQVSYVFYLVNKQGQPLNKSGQVVDFAYASFITDVFTQSVTWDQAEKLDVNLLAEKLLPSAYTVYDNSAAYAVRVYPSQDASKGEVNSFTITGGKGTTKVYNTKAGTKYSTPKTYYAQDAEGLDFASTVVAFAVLWEPSLASDTVVLDYGLDVVIDVVGNDSLQNTVSGISLSDLAYTSANVTMNSGISTTDKFTASHLEPDNGVIISIENENTIRIKQKNMSFTEPFTFYYESPVEYYEDSDKTSGFMYSSVTVIPATSIYYEENFVEFTDSTAKSGDMGAWSPVGTTVTKVQQADRPGTKEENAGTPDFDNLYGFDPAYKDSPTFSLGSAKKVTVNAATGTPETAPKAQFTFTGTGFDIVSLTNSTSGTIVVTVTDNDGEVVARKSVDTYYGYTSSANDDGTMTWTPTPVSDTLWQVPVIKMEGLGYGTYTVTIQVAYLKTLDHKGDGSYSFWLDGVRIYDPAGSNSDALSAYTKDKEASPSYVTLRDVLVAANALTVDKLTAAGVTSLGAVFVDGSATTKDIAIYANPGPNHETYLANGQGVAFKLVADKEPGAVHLGAKLALGSSATLKLGTADFVTLKTASDMYYDLSSKLTWTEVSGKFESNIIVLANSSSGTIISLTNLKATGGAKWNLSGVSATALADEDISFSIMPVVDGETVEFATRTLRQLAVASKPGFGDVAPGSWYANAVDYVTGHGLMVGAGNAFLPMGQVSRAQVVQTLFSMAGKPAFTAAKRFTDVAAGSWYAGAVNWAAASGVAAGSGNGTFAPDANVTREQLAIFLYAYSGAPEASADLSAFADGAKVSSWAVDAVEWAVSRHLISGKSGNLLDPQGTATRAELAQILMNFHKAI